MPTEREPRVRLVLSLRGLERVEIWGRDERDQQQAMQLFLRLGKLCDVTLPV
jgi:hypothetical protein